MRPLLFYSVFSSTFSIWFYLFIYLFYMFMFYIYVRICVGTIAIQCLRFISFSWLFVWRQFPYHFTRIVMLNIIWTKKNPFFPAIGLSSDFFLSRFKLCYVGSSFIEDARTRPHSFHFFFVSFVSYFDSFSFCRSYLFIYSYCRGNNHIYWSWCV